MHFFLSKITNSYFHSSITLTETSERDARGPNFMLNLLVFDGLFEKDRVGVK